MLAFQPSPFRAPKENEHFLSYLKQDEPPCRYLCFRNNTIRIMLSQTEWRLSLYYTGDLPIEKIHRPEIKRKFYLFYLVIQWNQSFIIGADSNNHVIKHAYVLFPNVFTYFINENFSVLANNCFFHKVSGCVSMGWHVFSLAPISGA